MKFARPPYSITLTELETFNQENLLTAFYEEHNLGEFKIEKLLCSPLREDKSPGCMWRLNFDGRIRFVDFSPKNLTIKAKEIHQFVGEYLKLNDYEAVEYLILFAYAKSIKRYNCGEAKTVYKNNSFNKSNIKLRYSICDFTQKGLDYWNDYGITIDDLNEDKVYQIDKFLMKKEDEVYPYSCKQELSFVFSDFSENKCKIYQPNKKRFYTNLDFELGNAKVLNNPQSKELYITTSYKDHRVIKNFFNKQKDVIWLQSEKTMPVIEDLAKMSVYDTIVNLEDNDEAGKLSGDSLEQLVSMFLAKELIRIRPKNEKDFADLRKNHGNKELNQYLC